MKGLEDVGIRKLEDVKMWELGNDLML